MKWEALMTCPCGCGKEIRFTSKLTCSDAQELDARRFLVALKTFGCEVVRQGKRPDVTAFMQEWRGGR